MSDMQIIGSCSLCGGAVAIPRLWAGINPPSATCTTCGAVAAPPGLPTIKMQRPASWREWARQYMPRALHGGTRKMTP